MAKENICIRQTSDYGKVEDEVMEILKKYELNYVEALGVLETLKASIFDSYCTEDGE